MSSYMYYIYLCVTLRVSSTFHIIKKQLSELIYASSLFFYKHLRVRWSPNKATKPLNFHWIPRMNFINQQHFILTLLIKNILNLHFDYPVFTTRWEAGGRGKLQRTNVERFRTISKILMNLEAETSGKD